MTRTNIRSRMYLVKEETYMEKVIERLNGNAVIILFVVLVLSSTIFMGINERKLANVSPENSNIVKTI